MKISREKKELSDVEKIKNFLLRLGFATNSYISYQNLIFSKMEKY